MTINTLTIEQHPKHEMRFRITVSEEVLGSSKLPINTVNLHHLEYFIRNIKRDLGSRAADLLRGSPALEWIIEYGGRTIWKRTCYKPRGRYEFVYRAGISVTFKERDKAMLFKLMWMNVQDDTPLAFAA